MNPRHVHEIMLACVAVLAILVAVASVFHMLTWTGIGWALLVTLATPALGLTTYLAYVIYRMETGYKTQDEISRRMRKQPGQTLHSLQTLLRVRILRHH